MRAVFRVRTRTVAIWGRRAQHTQRAGHAGIGKRPGSALRSGCQGRRSSDGTQRRRDDRAASFRRTSAGKRERSTSTRRVQTPCDSDGSASATQKYFGIERVLRGTYSISRRGHTVRQLLAVGEMAVARGRHRPRQVSKVGGTGRRSGISGHSSRPQSSLGTTRVRRRGRARRCSPAAGCSSGQHKVTPYASWAGRDRPSGSYSSLVGQRYATRTTGTRLHWNPMPAP